MRVEDTDRERSRQEFENAIYEDLKWLGIEPDESPLHGGDFDPYRQSERTSYKKYLEQLLQEKKAGYCDAAADAENKNEVHWCDKHGGFNQERKGIIRFKNPISSLFQDINGHDAIIFDDLIRGQILSLLDTLGDFSIARDINKPLYNFAVVVDDHEMQITHIVRGEDHIPNTSKQILLIEALNFKRPVYAHLPLVLAEDRSKLSKRKGAKSIQHYRDEGYLPEALLNFMALLGWNPGGEQEIFSKEELIEKFSLKDVQKSGAVFDEIKLDWMNGEYIRTKSVKELTELCRPFLKNIPEVPSEYLEKIIALEQPRLKKLSEIEERIDYFFQEPIYDKEMLRWKKMTDGELGESLERSIGLLEKLPAEAVKSNVESVFLEDIGTGDKGSVLWPLRVALTGKKASPGPFEIIEVLGPEKACKRLKAAKSLLK